MNVKRFIGQIGFAILIAAIIFYAVFPFYWAIVSSFKTGSALFTVELLPRHPTIENYVTLFAEQPFARNIMNSVIVASSSTWNRQAGSPRGPPTRFLRARRMPSGDSEGHSTLARSTRICRLAMSPSTR